MCGCLIVTIHCANFLGSWNFNSVICYSLLEKNMRKRKRHQQTAQVKKTMEWIESMNNTKIGAKKRLIILNICMNLNSTSVKSYVIRIYHHFALKSMYFFIYWFDNKTPVFKISNITVVLFCDKFPEAFSWFTIFSSILSHNPYQCFTRIFQSIQ